MVVAGKDKRNIKMKKLVVVTMAVAGHPAAGTPDKARQN